MIKIDFKFKFSDKPNAIGSDCSPSPKKFVANTDMERFELEEQKDERM